MTTEPIPKDDQIDGTMLQYEPEIDALVELMKEREAKRVLEIGFYRGGTIKRFDRDLRGAYFVSMDILKIKPASLKAFDETLHNRFTYIEADSGTHGAVESVRHIVEDQEKEKFDMLFIDGQHDGLYPMRDFVNYMDFVKDGGLIAWHDINYFNVRQYYHDAISETGWAHKEIVNIPTDLPTWCGIGVIFKGLEA